MEGGLDLRRHDAAQRHIILAVVGLTVMFHSQSEPEVERQTGQPNVIASHSDQLQLVEQFVCVLHMSCFVSSYEG